jgi:ssDNA-binding Zn-finger/Zn-ribbon topoisomerase 1
MVTAASLNGKAGKCSNFGNCSIADARKTVEVPTGMDFVCEECRKPLLLIEAEGKAGISKSIFIILLLIVLLVGGGAAWFFLQGNKAPVEAPIIAPKIVAPPIETPAAPLTGHCSAADAKAGLCKSVR